MMMCTVATFRRPLLDEPVVEKPRPRSGSASRIAEALSVDTSLDALLDDARRRRPARQDEGARRFDHADDARCPYRLRETNRCVRCNFDHQVTTTKVEEEEITHHERIRIHGHVSGRDPRWHGSLGRQSTGRPDGPRSGKARLLLGDAARTLIVEPWERRGWRKNDTSQTIDGVSCTPTAHGRGTSARPGPAQGGVRAASGRAAS